MRTTAKTSSEQAHAELRKAGYEPLSPYPGRVTYAWQVRCVRCGTDSSTCLNRIRSGRVCKHSRVTFERAEAELRAAGYEPLEDYPGRTAIPWKVQCRFCGHICTRTRFKLRTPCPCVARARQAEAEIRVAGYTPEEPYPGTARAPWTVRCVECGKIRHPNLDRIRSGERCLHRNLSASPR